MKNTIIRNRVFGGKGELLCPSFFISSHNLFKAKWVKCVVILLVAFFLNSTISQNIVLARTSGGADLDDLDSGDIALSVGISLVSFGVGSAIGSGISSAAAGTGFGAGVSSGLGSLASASTWANNFGTAAAMTQIGSAVSSYGNYKEWDESRTILVSSIAQGVAGGAMNPTSTLGLTSGSNVGLGTIAQGALVGGLEGGVSGGVTASLAHNNGEKNANGIRTGGYEPWMGFVGGMAGNVVGGMANSTISGTRANQMSSFVDAGVSNMVSSVGSGLLTMGKGYIKEDKDTGDKYLIDAAFQGAYPIVNQSWNKYVVPGVNGLIDKPQAAATNNLLPRGAAADLVPSSYSGSASQDLGVKPTSGPTGTTLQQRQELKNVLKVN